MHAYTLDIHTNLVNTVFWDWLERYVGNETMGELFDSLMDKFSYAECDRSYTRDEMNER